MNSSPAWADGPFPLIATPISQQNDPKKAFGDPYLLAASVMALNHNMILRGLNSIFLQAQHIPAQEVGNFVNYAQCWCEVLRGHHDIEEDYLFPEIERYTKDKKFVEVNVEQHEAFLGPLQKLEAHLKHVKSAPAEFSGKSLCEMISTFAPILQRHLEEEIPSMISLSKYGAELPIANLMRETGSKAAAASSKTTAGVFFILNVDTGFENGMWSFWPPMPTVARMGPFRAMMWWHYGWWKYASCDIYGRKKVLGK